MIQHLVAFDFETAGLSSKRFDVIEVGAVRFQTDGTVLDTFHSMADPGHPLSLMIDAVAGERCGPNADQTWTEQSRRYSLLITRTR